MAEYHKSFETNFRIIIAVLIIILGFFVALSPNLFYAPTPRVVLYLLVSCLPAILFASEASARFDMKIPGFVATAGGSAAIMFIALFLLTYLSKPELQIAVYSIHYQNGEPVQGLNRPDCVTIPISDNGLQLTKFVDNNSVIVIFPEQVGESQINVRPVSGGPIYSGKISYAGTRVRNLYLQTDLKILAKN